MRPFDHLTLMQFLWSFLSIVGFCVRVNLKGCRILLISLGAGLAWALYLILLYFTESVLFSVFLSIILVSIYSEIVARACRTPVSVFITCVIIPLVPGSNLFYSMQAYVAGNTSLAGAQITKVLMISGVIAMAVAVVSSVTNLLLRLLNRF